MADIFIQLIYLICYNSMNDFGKNLFVCFKLKIGNLTDMFITQYTLYLTPNDKKNSKWSHNFFHKNQSKKWLCTPFLKRFFYYHWKNKFNLNVNYALTKNSSKSLVIFVFPFSLPDDWLDLRVLASQHVSRFGLKTTTQFLSRVTGGHILPL